MRRAAARVASRRTATGRSPSILVMVQAEASAASAGPGRSGPVLALGALLSSLERCRLLRSGTERRPSREHSWYRSWSALGLQSSVSWAALRRLRRPQVARSARVGTRAGALGHRRPGARSWGGPARRRFGAFRWVAPDRADRRCTVPRDRAAGAVPQRADRAGANRDVQHACRALLRLGLPGGRCYRCMGAWVPP